MDDFDPTFDLSTWQVCFYSPQGTSAQEEAPLSVDNPSTKVSSRDLLQPPSWASLYFYCDFSHCLLLAGCSQCGVLCNPHYLVEGPVLLHIPVSSSRFASLLGMCLIMLVTPFSFFKSLMRLISESCVSLSLYRLHICCCLSIFNPK